MALSLDDFVSASKPNRMKCRIVMILDSLDPADAKVVAEAISNPAVTNSALAKVLTSNGHEISNVAIGRHRRGDCACDR